MKSFHRNVLGKKRSSRRKTKEPERRETQKALQCYEIYRDLGVHRSFDALMVKLGEFSDVISPTPSKGTVYNWSHRHGWDERVKRWDAEQQMEAERRAREERQQELMENLRRFRAVGDRAVVNSMLTNAETLESVRNIAKQVLQRIELEAVTNLRDLAAVADTLEKLTRNTDKAFELKAKIEGMEAVLEAMDKG